MNANTPDDERFLREALPAFVSESIELLDQLEHLLLELETAPQDRDLLDALFRCAHTIKGSAGLFGLDEIVEFTHHVETYLDALREAKVSLTRHTSQVLLRAADQIRRLIGMLGDAGADPAQHIGDERASLIADLARELSNSHPSPTHEATQCDQVESTASGQAASGGTHRITLHFKRDTFRDGFDPIAILDYLATLGAIDSLVLDTSRLPAFEALDAEDCHLDISLHLTSTHSTQDIEAAFDLVREDCDVSIASLEAHTESVDANNAASEAASLAQAVSTERKPTVERRASDDNRFVRVRADRLDEVINLLGELVIAGAGTALLAQKTGVSDLIESSHQLGRLIEEIRNGTLQLRMVQIGETFGRFRRVVHDLAAELGKDVHLDIVGGETELDKSVVERIADPLMHLVRNALDHGLETREQRLASGKSEQGSLRIAASHDAGGILISIQDDGRGIDRVRVLARARERGLVAVGSTPSDSDLLALIFEPGFSTAEQVTNLSGRGVGMDVVRRNIESLRGRIDLHSEPGQGTRIEVRLPLTLAIIDGFLVGVGQSKFIFPLDAVVEVIESRPTETAVNASGCSVVELRGQMLPIVSLRTLYSLDSDAPERSSVVVIQSGGRRYGVMVDALLGQHQTVIKPLSRMFRSLRGMSGSSILGNGEVALIFDVTSLCELAEHPPTMHRSTLPEDGSLRLKPPTDGLSLNQAQDSN